VELIFTGLICLFLLWIKWICIYMKLYKINFRAFLLPCLFMIGCSEINEQLPPTNYFDTTIELQGEVFPLNSDNLHNPSHLLVVDSLLFIHDQIPEGDNLYLFRVIHRQTGEVLSTFGREGQGPDEFSFPSFLTRIPKNPDIIGIHNRRYFFFNELLIDRILTNSNPMTINSYDELGGFFRVIKNQNFLVGTGRFPEGRYTVINTNGQILNQFGEYPFQDGFQIPFPVLGMAYQSVLGVHPDGTLMVSATTSSANLEILDIESQELEVVTRIHSYPTYFRNESMDVDNLSAPIESHNRWGYPDIDVTSNFIYALYSGKKIQDNRNHFWFGNKVLVFDWEGNPVNMLMLDREVKSISVDNGDNTLFGITENEEGASEIVVFELAET
jgi:hypothetical protein